MAESGGLEIRYLVRTGSWVRIPLSPPLSASKACMHNHVIEVIFLFLTLSMFISYILGYILGMLINSGSLQVNQITYQHLVSVAIPFISYVLVFFILKSL